MFRVIVESHGFDFAHSDAGVVCIHRYALMFQELSKLDGYPITERLINGQY